MNERDATIKAFQENQYPINPPLPKNWDNTPNENRPQWQIELLWNRPYIQVQEYFGNPNNEELKKEWAEWWPEGKRFDVRCLDGGAWDRPTCWGMFKTLKEAISCCESGRFNEVQLNRKTT